MIQIISIISSRLSFQLQLIRLTIWNELLKIDQNFRKQSWCQIGTKWLQTSDHFQFESLPWGGKIQQQCTLSTQTSWNQLHLLIGLKIICLEILRFCFYLPAFDVGIARYSWEFFSQFFGYGTSDFQVIEGIDSLSK